MIDRKARHNVKKAKAKLIKNKKRSKDLCQL